MMRFLLYCLCGGAGVLCDFLLYYWVFTLGVSYQIANVAGYITGTCISFLLNRIITFDVRDRIVRRLALFLCVAGVGFLVSAMLLWFLVSVLAVDARYAKLLTLPIVVVLQYSLNRWITFRQNQPAKN